MVSKETLIDLLPERDTVVVEEPRQTTDNIRELIIAKHKEYAPDYDRISHYFDTGNIVDTSKQIFEFLKFNVPYSKESGSVQTVKSPRHILSDNDNSTPYDRVDCKNYSAFIAGVIDSIKRNNPGDTWDWTYRFASYDENVSEPGHVFVVVKIEGRELWIDPVFTYFNGGDMHEWEIDEKPESVGIGALYSISGPGDGTTTSTVTVNKEVAWARFLFMVNNNIFSLRDLLVQNPAITTTALRNYCIENGFDYNQLINFIRHPSPNA
jgi:hypothetical protein